MDGKLNSGGTTKDHLLIERLNADTPTPSANERRGLVFFHNGLRGLIRFSPGSGTRLRKAYATNSSTNSAIAGPDLSPPSYHARGQGCCAPGGCQGTLSHHAGCKLLLDGRYLPHPSWTQLFTIAPCRIQTPPVRV